MKPAGLPAGFFVAATIPAAALVLASKIQRRASIILGWRTPGCLESLTSVKGGLVGGQAQEITGEGREPQAR
jgi:hypothetical protein